MNRVIAALHSVDPASVGLAGYGKPGNYFERQIGRWTKQYLASITEPIEAMDRLIEWLPAHIPASARDDTQVAIVHGDYRLDNLVFAADEPRIVAVLDWELSTLGHPLADFSYHCMSWHIPPGSFRGIGGLDHAALGIPTEREYVAPLLRAHRQDRQRKRCRRGDGRLEFLPRLQPVPDRRHPARHRQARRGRHGVERQGAPVGRRRAAARGNGLAHRPAKLRRRAASSRHSRKTTMDFEYSPRTKELQAQLLRFMDEHIYPAEQRYEDEIEANTKAGKRWTPLQTIETLKPKARAQGLWNLFLPPTAGGKGSKESGRDFGLSNGDYAPLAEIMGRVPWSPEVFNCSAPDTGNMETIERYGSPTLKDRWLQPLLDGKIRSAFAMTEPAVASSDATNIESSIRREGDEYVINGRKWWTSGAGDPRCKIYVFMGKTDPDAPRHSQQSMVLVPAETKGITIVRPLSVFGYDDAPHGHMEVLFENVRVPVDNILLGEGRGFEIAQGRLGPGRIHHCMRLIGLAERSLELMCKRASSRVAFGRTVAEQGVTRERIAESRCQIDMARLLTLKAAWMMDVAGNKAAKAEIAMIKVVAPNMACQVIDWAMQVHGGGGVSGDFPLAGFYAGARTLRFADGPDEVHRNAIAKIELGRHA